MTLNEVYKLGIEKFKLHTPHYSEDTAYEIKSCRDGMFYDHERGYDLLHINNWMTSFVIGLAPLFYRTEKDSAYLDYANRFKDIYKKKVFEAYTDTMHDIGFLYSPYSVAMYQLTGDEEHKNSAVRAAEVLVGRFREKGRFLEAWGKMGTPDAEGRAIVDSMMNILLLLWAYKQTGRAVFADVAKAHADTTRKYFVREDGSVAHSYLFDLESGDILRESNTCGYSNGSYWARGSAWAVYGFAKAAKYLNSKEYYDTAAFLADKYISQLEENTFIPTWDFKLPKDKPAEGLKTQFKSFWDESDAENKKYNVDTSAAAIMACAFMELNSIKESEKLMSFVKGSLEALSSSEYVNADLSVPALLSHQNGCMTYTSYGDFFLLQALQTYLYKTDTCW